MEFMDFTHGKVAPDVEAKKRFVCVIREVRPDLLITQDPEHSFHDLAPDRREAMILYLVVVNSGRLLTFQAGVRPSVRRP